MGRTQTHAGRVVGKAREENNETDTRLTLRCRVGAFGPADSCKFSKSAAVRSSKTDHIVMVLKNPENLKTVRNIKSQLPYLGKVGWRSGSRPRVVCRGFKDAGRRRVVSNEPPPFEHRLPTTAQTPSKTTTAWTHRLKPPPLEDHHDAREEVLGGQTRVSRSEKLLLGRQVDLSGLHDVSCWIDICLPLRSS